MHSPEVEQNGGGIWTAFCLESLMELTENRKHTPWIVGPKHHWWREWRQVDWDTVSRHKNDLIEWVRGYRGEPRFNYPRVMPLRNTWSRETSLKNFDVYVEEVEELQLALSYEIGIWQRPWPDVSEQVGITLRSRS